MTTPILGFDIAKNKFDYCFLTPSGKQTGTCENNAAGLAQLDRKLLELKITGFHAGMEATGRYGRALANHLHHKNQKVSVINPRCIKSYAESKLCRNKTDQADAATIAQFVKETCPDPWIPPSAAILELQELTRLLQARKEAWTRDKNRLSPDIQSKVVAREIKRSIVQAEKNISRLEKAVSTHLKAHPELLQQVSLLCSIPGVGQTTAAIFLAELPPVDRFDSPSQAAAFAGLNPRQSTSGSSLRGKTRMGKTGNRQIRRALYMPALSAHQCNPAIQAAAARLKAAGKPPMCIVGASMHRLLRIMFGVLKHGQPFDPQWHQKQSLLKTKKPN